MLLSENRPQFTKAPGKLHGRYRKFKWFAWYPVRLRGDQRLVVFENVVRHENVWGWGFLDVWYTKGNTE
ncbi:hypothetical protein LCGC14_2087210 [marine sediment metagenome]|uniref:Uncharacterized protein n=1 Tax=marine sediment metagenome TaxID=412755 RepID=A0A0F9GS20_9ZZZZ